MGHLPYAGDGFPRMAGDWRRKAPRKKGNTGKKKGKGNKGADRRATRAVSEGRTDGACGRRPKQSGPPSWAARACGEAGRRRAGLGWCGAAGARQAERSGPPSRPTREGGRNWATEQRAKAGKTGRRGREGRLGRFLAGLKRWEGRFFK